MLKKTQAQSIGEYMILVMVVIAALVVMVPLFRRGTQSLIKAGADQIGAQSQAEQDFSANGTGYTNFLNADMNSLVETETRDYSGAKLIGTYQETNTVSNSSTYLGFTAN